MNDHITDDLTTDMAIAAALRTFLTSPAIISMIQACVTEAANAEVQRLISDDRILNVVSAAISAPCSPAQSQLSDKLGSVIRADIAEETRNLLSEDRARDFIRDEIEDEPHYFTRAIERVADSYIDIDDIVDTVKDQVIDDLDLDNLGIDDKINEVLESRTADIGDHIVEYFDDDGNLRSLTKRVVESISISITPSI
jgi:hypothetical protein